MRSSLASSANRRVGLGVADRDRDHSACQHDLGYGAEPGEHPEHQLQPLLNSHVGILDYHAAWIPNLADRQGESELATFCFGEQSGGQSTADRVKFELRYHSLQAEE